MPRVRSGLLAFEAKKSLRSYLRSRLWYWARKDNFTISLDYAIHLLNSKPNDPFALCVGEEIAKYSGEKELEDKCRRASSKLSFVKRSADVLDLLSCDDVAANDIRLWRDELKIKYGSFPKANYLICDHEKEVPKEESLLVKSSATLESIQEFCFEASFRANYKPLVEVLHPPESPYGRGLFTLQKVNAGSCLLIDEPIMVFPGSKNVCAYCLTPVHTVNALEGHSDKEERSALGIDCPHCGLERYCSARCCKAAWEAYHCCTCRVRNEAFSEWHEKVKETLASCKEFWGDPNSSYRVSLACLAVSKLCAMATVKQCHPLKMEKINFLRGIAHYERKTTLHQVGSLAVLLSSTLHQPYLFLEDVLSLFAVLQTNEFLVDGNVALYPLLSLLNHSCIPNCVAVGTSGKPAKRQLLAITNIREGEQLFIDYNSSLSSLLKYDDRKALCAQRQFTCCCPKCLRKE